MSNANANAILKLHKKSNDKKREFNDFYNLFENREE